MSNELLEKVISTSVIGANGVGGLLTPEQSGRFIDYMWNSTVLGPQVRTVRMRANEVELDRMAVGERLVRLATEAVSDPVQGRSVHRLPRILEPGPTSSGRIQRGVRALRGRLGHRRVVGLRRSLRRRGREPAGSRVPARGAFPGTRRLPLHFR